jgi:hypothetical protein
MAKHPRAHLLPLQGGPWLDDTSQTRACRYMGGGGLLTVVLSILIGHASTSGQVFWVFLCAVGLMLGVFGVLGYGASVLARHARQTCPACLGTMPRGAITCPHCQFHATQETQ